MQSGDEMVVVDGKGNRYQCRLLEAHPKKAAVEILKVEKIAQYWTGDITIAVAPTKHMDRMEWMTEKLTEIGISRLVPLLCRYSERKEIKIDRLVKTAVSAMKQSLKATLPEIDEMTPFRQFITADRSELKFIACCFDDMPRQLLSNLYVPGKSVTIMIGPEGDFTSEEVKAAFEAGFIPVSFGDARLRTETAAIVACDTIHILNQLQNNN